MSIRTLDQDVLHVLPSRESLTETCLKASDIRDMLGCSQSNLYRVLARLENENCIQVVQSFDDTVRRYRLLPEGEKAYLRMVEISKG